MSDRRIEVVVVAGSLDGRADVVRLADAETPDDLAAALADALSSNPAELVLDLRCEGRPPFELPRALDVAQRALEEHDASIRVRCVVASEDLASRLRARVRGPAHPSAVFRSGDRRIELLQGDVTTTRADAVVNASNTMLKLGAGVSGALRRACGPGLQAEMSARAPVEPGGIAVTGPHGLATAGRLLHVATADGTESSVTHALRNVLRVCNELGLASVALPLLGTGTGGLAPSRFAELLCDALAEHAVASPTLVRVVAWSSEDYVVVANVLAADPRVAPA